MTTSKVYNIYMIRLLTIEKQRGKEENQRETKKVKRMDVVQIQESYTFSHGGVLKCQEGSHVTITMALQRQIDTMSSQASLGTI